MSKKEIRLFSAVCFLSGLVLGFLASPVKYGFTLACNNTIEPSKSRSGGAHLRKGKAAVFPDADENFE